MASIFSRIVAGEIPAHVVAEDADHLAFLDVQAVVLGHTLVIPKKEVDYIFDLEPQAYAALWLFAQKVARGLASAVPCKRVGITVIGLEVPHAHVHLVPMHTMDDINFSKPRIKQESEQMVSLARRIGEAIVL